MVFKRCEGAGPVIVIGAVGIISQIEVHPETIVSQMLRLEVAPGWVSFFTSQAVHEWKKIAILAVINGQLSGLAINREAELAITLIFLNITGGRLHLDVLLLWEFLHCDFKTQIRIRLEIFESLKFLFLSRREWALAIMRKEFILHLSKFF